MKEKDLLNALNVDIEIFGPLMIHASWFAGGPSTYMALSDQAMHTIIENGSISFVYQSLKVEAGFYRCTFFAYLKM